MPLLVDGDTDDMIDSSPFLKFPAHPGLRIRAQGPRNCSGSRKESAWRTCYATVSMNQAQVVLPRRTKETLDLSTEFTLAWRYKPKHFKSSSEGQRPSAHQPAEPWRW